MSKPECVLVVDEISDTADVLQAVLEPRGVAVSRVRRLGEPAGAVIRPSLMVLDAESLAGSAPRCDQGWHGIPQVIIGSITVDEPAQSDDRIAHSGRRYLQKPFQFAELMEAIESLISPVRPRAPSPPC